MLDTAKNILRAKITRPSLSTQYLSRPGIVQKLEARLCRAAEFNYPLTLVSAPAGFGKTSAVVHWLQDKQRVAWLTLDSQDDQRVRFWTYLLAALQSQGPRLGRGTQALIQHMEGTDAALPADMLLTSLLNDLFNTAEQYFVVIDDFHLIESRPIQEDCFFLLSHLPPSTHMVVITRSDPPWPLARFRSQGLLEELRQKQLTFSLPETKAFVQQDSQQSLSEQDTAILHRKTEGWITGIQLARYSLIESSDPERFIADFQASQRHVFHFLSQEVFEHQSREIQQFLVQTSILQRFSAPVCEAVTQNPNSQTLLKTLDAQNLFVIPLDERQEWYRYHPLFADYLTSYLSSDSQSLRALHKAAARWFEATAMVDEAVFHLQQAADHEAVAQLLDANLETLLFANGPSRLVGMIDALPQAVLEQQPRLLIHKAWLALIHKGRDAAGRSLAALAPQVEKLPPESRGMLAVVHSYYQLYGQQVSQALRSAAEALALLPESNLYWRSNILVISGDIRLFSGNPAAAHSFYSQAYRHNLRAQKHYLAISTGFKTATALHYRGRTKEAEALVRELLQLAEEHGFARVTRVGLLWALLGEILRQQGSLDEAERCIERGIVISFAEIPSRGWNFLGRIRLAFSRRDFPSVDQTLADLERLHEISTLPNFIISPATVYRARLLAQTQNAAAARDTLARLGIDLTSSQDIRGGQEEGYLLLMWLELENNGADRSRIRRTFDALITQARSSEHQEVLLSALIGRALWEQRWGDRLLVWEYLEEVLQQSRDSGWIQLLRDHRAPLECLLASGQNSPEGGSIRKHLLERLGSGVQKKSASDLSPEGEETAADSVAFMEDLTAREQQILTLICAGLSNVEISAELHLSPGTVKWYTSSIYGKLGVKNRTEAAVFAQSRGLLPQD